MARRRATRRRASYLQAWRRGPACDGGVGGRPYMAVRPAAAAHIMPSAKWWRPAKLTAVTPASMTAALSPASQLLPLHVCSSYGQALCSSSCGSAFCKRLFLLYRANNVLSPHLFSKHIAEHSARRPWYAAIPRAEARRAVEARRWRGEIGKISSNDDLLRKGPAARRRTWLSSYSA